MYVIIGGNNWETAPFQTLWFAISEWSKNVSHVTVGAVNLGNKLYILISYAWMTCSCQSDTKTH